MSGIDHLVHQHSEWLKTTGPMSEVVVSSRLRLARNLAKYPFLTRLELEQRAELVAAVERALRESPSTKDILFFRSSELDEIDRQFLVERHLVSREHVEDKNGNAVGISPDEIVSLMVLEEDHLRLQTFQSGFNLHEAWHIISRIDDQLDGALNYSFSPNLGYLTACPTNVGTGLRASCMLHLPGLVLIKQVHKVLQALAKLNLAARGLYGEGTQATGNLFQFSNQMTLGQREEEIIDNLERVIRQVVEHEREARAYLREKKKIKFEDQIWRALGSLKSARLISSAEATQLLSLLHLGIDIGLIQTALTRQDLNALFLLIQPAHLQKISGRELSAPDRDIRRAELIRERLVKINF